MDVVNQLDEALWSSFVDQHPQGNIFHTPEMFHVFQRTKGYTPEFWAAIGKDGQPLVLFLPVHISLRSGLLQNVTSRSIVFGGILTVDTEEARKALPLVLEEYKRTSGQRSVFTELRNVSQATELQPLLQSSGFTYEDHLNYLIPLDHSPETVFSRIGKRTQRNIRHGLNRGLVRVEEVNSHMDLEQACTLLRKTYQAAHVPLADSSLFESAYEYLSPKGMCMVTIARVGNAPAATSFELLYKDVIYGWYGGMDREYGSYVPNELLMRSILCWGSEQGFRCYDFGGAGKPGEEYGVRDFKAKFGGDLVCYGRNTWVPHPFLMSFCKAGYQVLRRRL
jgi:hypothetical protein